MRIAHERPCGGPEDPLALTEGRVHEAEGSGRTGFALFQAVRRPGTIFWIALARSRRLLLPAALPGGVAERICHVAAPDETGLLWTAEEALRSRAAALVVAEPEKPLSLTAGRRLQLAAEAGACTGLLLIGAGGGSNATETRWRCEPLPGPDRHRWELVRNKRGATGCREVSWTGATAAFRLLPASG